ncbi:MAG TPA: hypothetical protein VMZ30_10590 [Pyrinomonadaceae bacterium]|nr:hypothetical protein [Pyrinomonadaceae bacterium]
MYGSAWHPMCGGGDAPPTAARLFLGYALRPGLVLRVYWAKGRTRGVAQTEKAIYGGA